MKRQTYQRGVEFIAMNDEPEELDVEVISGYVSVHTLSATFEMDTGRIARDVLRVRQNQLAIEKL